MPREPRKKGISNGAICTETTIDCKGNSLMGAVCNERIKTTNIMIFFDGKLSEDITFALIVISDMLVKGIRVLSPFYKVMACHSQSYSLIISTSS